MRFTIHDVGHGFCAELLHDNGNLMLWDAGHKDYPEHRPSRFLPARGITTIQRLLVTNYDEDHVSDLPYLRASTYIETLRRNKSIDAVELRRLKREGGPITPAMESLLAMMANYTAPVTEPPEFPGVVCRTFHNDYGRHFVDTNNISLITFLVSGHVNAIIPGDVETVGWRRLLEDKALRDELRCVGVFVASHHGRESGYCAEVFEYCRPQVVIFSDSQVKCASQEMASVYAQHASGLEFNGQTRYVLSTRNDGSLSWSW